MLKWDYDNTNMVISIEEFRVGFTSLSKDMLKSLMSRAQISCTNIRLNRVDVDDFMKSIGLSLFEDTEYETFADQFLGDVHEPDHIISPSKNGAIFTSCNDTKGKYAHNRVSLNSVHEVEFGMGENVVTAKFRIESLTELNDVDASVIMCEGKLITDKTLQELHTSFEKNMLLSITKSITLFTPTYMLGLDKEDCYTCAMFEDKTLLDSPYTEDGDELIISESKPPKPNPSGTRSLKESYTPKNK